MLDFIRIACAVPAVRVGDVVGNTKDICDYMEKADAAKADILLFPELALTGYSCGDLFFQEVLHDAVKLGLKQIVDCSAKHPRVVAVVGLPVRIGAQLYNCAAVIAHGEISGIVPKTYLPNYDEFSEKRWFCSGAELGEAWLEPEDLGLAASQDFWSVPVKSSQLFRVGEDAVVGVEICEDLMTPCPPSGLLALNGAEVILNLSASNALAGKRSFRRELVKHQSSVCSCIYAYASAGYTESTQDLVFSGHSIIAENGTILQENHMPIASNYMIIQDCDLGRVRADRRKKQLCGSATGQREKAGFLVRQPYGEHLRADGTLYPLQKLPFVPSNESQRKELCREVFEIQVAGLRQRLSAIGANAVVGVSGGLDSTLALLVAAEAMRQLGRPMTDVHGVTMPCFGTSDRTYQNSLELMDRLGISSKEISIREAVSLHFRDIGHEPSVHNATYENAQARERTQVLMDYASVVGGIVVGTGDLSELALGWCTYNGDHMSMYGVNASVPKTMIRWIIETVAQSPEFAAAGAVLQDILDTPISPELLPPDAEGRITQQTEELVGPYALHDFFLYHMLRFGFTPKKIYTLACRAFREDFDAATVKKWLRFFYQRFFSQQFKRSCIPDGVKATAISLSPRGNWHMPSDAIGRIWLDEVEKL